MSTLSLRRNERQQPAVPDEIIPELAPQWDPKATYLNIRGIVGVQFMQGVNYFNCRKEFVKEVPAKERLKMPAAPKAPVVQHRGVMMVGRSANGERTTVVPQSIASAQKENAQALAAEEHAE